MDWNLINDMRVKGISIAEVAKKSKISEGAIQRHFHGRWRGHLILNDEGIDEEVEELRILGLRPSQISKKLFIDRAELSRYIVSHPDSRVEWTNEGRKFYPEGVDKDKEDLTQWIK
jgi:AcrR family transcriptional regulator